VIGCEIYDALYKLLTNNKVSHKLKFLSQIVQASILSNSEI